MKTLSHSSTSPRNQHSASSHLRWTLLVLMAAATLLGGCEVLSEIFQLNGNAELTGQNAFVHLERDDSRRPTTNIKSVMKVMSWQSEGGSSTDSIERFEPGDEVIDLLRKNTRSRRNIRTSNFQRVAFPVPKDARRVKDGHLFPVPDFKGMEGEFLIPRAEQIPVRNQGMRGTCAAFAGIGQIEYTAIKQDTSLGSLDLSEQRFYYNSKPECQSSGCSVPGDEGSWYGDGVDASLASSTYDIPLEKDCPYNAYPGSTDLQLPQANSCSDGAVRVTKQETVTTPQQIIDALHRGFAVPFASPLSGNWEENKGLITHAESGYTGSTSHAAGHAYLIVGYRLLPNMPEEGGMCFVVKNSWGNGWGVNGYSCMTLEWIQNWHFDFAFDHPIATALDIRSDVTGGGGGGGGQDDGGFFDGYEDETVDRDRLDDDAIIPDAEPNDLTWDRAFLLGPDDAFYRAEIAEDGGSLYLRGYMGDSRETGYVKFTRSGSDLMFDGDVVGNIKGDEVSVCTGSFDILCSLRIDEEQNELYVEFLNPEFREVRASELTGGNWAAYDLGLPGGYQVQFFESDDTFGQLLDRKFFLRLDDGSGTGSNPLRLGIGGNGDINLMGNAVGNLVPGSSFGLCSGDHAQSCSMFSSKRGLQVLPSW